MSSHNEQLQEKNLSSTHKSIWRSVNMLIGKYGNSDTRLTLLKQGASTSKPRIQQRLKVEKTLVRADNLTPTAYKDSLQFRKMSKAEEAAFESANKTLDTPELREQLRKTASPEKTFAGHPVWTASKWNAVEARCDRCRGSGKMTCSSCGGNPRKQCLSCSGGGHQKCGVCGGIGMQGNQACVMCGGAGGKSCPSCHGSGTYGHCHACRNGKVTCSKCNGSRRMYQGVAGRLVVDSESQVFPDESYPLKSGKRTNPQWICSQADHCETLSASVVDGKYAVEWKLSVSIPYLQYSVDEKTFTSTVEGKSTEPLFHGPFFDKRFEETLKGAMNLFRRNDPSEDNLKTACDNLSKDKLGNAILKLSVHRHRNPSKLSQELKGALSEKLLSKGFGFTNNVVSKISELSGRIWLHRGCLAIGIVTSLILVFDKWITPSKWLKNALDIDIHPISIAVSAPFLLTGLLTGRFAVRATLKLKRITGFHMQPRRASKRTTLFLLGGALSGLITLVFMVIAHAITK